MLWRLPIALEQVKAGKSSGKLFVLCINQKKLPRKYISVSVTHWKMWKSYNSDKFKISDQTWNDKFQLPDGSYLISDIQDYIEYISKNHVENIHSPSIRTDVNKIENRLH